MRKIIMASITAVVVIAVLAGTLIPVLDDATTTQESFTNDGFYRMSKFASTDTYALSWSYESPNKVTVNGEDVALPTASTTYSYTIIGNSDFFVRYVVSNSGTTVVMQLYSTGATYEAKTASSQNMDITLSSGTMTFDNGSGTTKSVSITDSFYSVDPDGDMILKSATDYAYVLGDSEIVGIGRTDIGGTVCRVFVSGTIDDGFTGSMSTINGVAVTMGDITATYSKNKTCECYEFQKVSFDATYSDTTVAATYSQVLVPYEITAEKSVHFTDGENAILNAIPVIVIVALLLGVVAIVLRSRMD